MVPPAAPEGPPSTPAPKSPVPRLALQMPIAKIRFRREAQRLLEEEEFQEQKEEAEEGGILDPMNDFEGLQEASGLDTSPEWELSSPKAIPSQEVSSYHFIIRKAADLLNLQLPTAEVKSNILTEVLHSPSSVMEPLLLLNEALKKSILEVWQKALSAPAVSRMVARQYKVASGDPAFLSTHPSPESLVF